MLFQSQTSHGILALMSTIMAHFKADNVESSRKSEELFLQILSILIDKKQQTGIPSVPTPLTEAPGWENTDYVAAAKEYIEGNYQFNISADSVAKYIGLERSHFSRMFSRESGGNLRDYLIKTRMDQACRLLETTNFTVQAVAKSVGYENYAPFARRFKSYTGVSAGEWRSRRIF